ncbi:hypothetical protein JXI42_09785 [bacterium]|nr:hypothetical protein [bacterium]
MEYRRYSRKLKHLASTPFIWSTVIPLVILDIFTEIYHHVCFPLYGIPLVHRKTYIRIDRYKLQYLKWFEKLNCAFCGYANGLLHYAFVIAGETEKYWCGIKHKKYKGFLPPSHHEGFVEYGDEKGLQRKYRLKN